MQLEEQRLIEGLFQRLKQAEQQSGARDAQADRLISDFVRQQPAAAYYMTQSILIQEAALKRLHAQVQQLENEVATLKSQPPASGGFLSSLFGGARSQPQQPANNWNSGQQPPAPNYAQQPPACISGGRVHVRCVTNGCRCGRRCGDRRHAHQHVPSLATARDCEHY